MFIFLYFLAFLFFFPVSDGKGEKNMKNAEKDDFNLEGRAKHLFAGQNTQHPFLRHSQNLVDNIHF